jgi:single-strand DNA-binding protein
MNIVILQGNLGADPELRYTQSGSAVLNMRLATTTKFKRGDEWDERTDWHSCEIWNKRAEALAKILEKGTRILIRGSIKYGSYEDKEGVKRYTTTIAIDDLELLGKGKGGGDNDSRRSNSSSGNSSNRQSSGGGSRNQNHSQSQTSKPRNDEPNFDDPGGSGDDDIPF